MLVGLHHQALLQGVLPDGLHDVPIHHRALRVERAHHLRVIARAESSTKYRGRPLLLALVLLLLLVRGGLALLGRALLARPRVLHLDVAAALLQPTHRAREHRLGGVLAGVSGLHRRRAEVHHDRRNLICKQIGGREEKARVRDRGRDRRRARESDPIARGSRADRDASRDARERLGTWTAVRGVREDGRGRGRRRSRASSVHGARGGRRESAPKCGRSDHRGLRRRTPRRATAGLVRAADARPRRGRFRGGARDRCGKTRGVGDGAIPADNILLEANHSQQTDQTTCSLTRLTSAPGRLSLSRKRSSRRRGRWR